VPTFGQGVSRKSIDACIWSKPIALSFCKAVITIDLMSAYSWTSTILVHATAATAALGLGMVILARRKGTPSHRALGWLWVLLMTLVATTSLLIYREQWSWIHALSVWSLISIVYGVRMARNRQVKAHRYTMIALFAALVITGLFTLLPGRLIGRALGGDEGEASLMHAARLPDWVVANEDDPVRHARFEVGNSIRRYPPMLARSNRLPARRWPSAACRRVGCGLTFLRVHV
jgi:uncharacterized membrane protein